MTTAIMSPARAVSNIVPDYEIRLLLNPTAVLSSEHELIITVLLTFEILSLLQK